MTTLSALEKTRLYSEELEIDLSAESDKELFKWFVAAILFGHRISETIAKRTFETFRRYRLLNPEKIIDAGWDYLVNPIMAEGGFVRYDGKTSTQMLRVCTKLLSDYDGRLSKLYNEATGARDLEERLTAFYGIGPVTTNIFLRELRSHWSKSDPKPLPIVKKLARQNGIDLAGLDPKSLRFTRVEAGLIRMRKEAA